MTGATGEVGGSEPSGVRREEIVSTFHRLYYDSYRTGGTWYATSWLGVPTWKLPLDLWIYQEIVHQVRPDLIVETGTAFGGSALYLASLCDLVRGGEVVSVDVKDEPRRPRHERITYLAGSSTAPEIVREVHARAAGKESVLVILDSDHTKAHVLAEMRAYGPLVPLGGYMIVEDTNVNGHRSTRTSGLAPWRPSRSSSRPAATFKSTRPRRNSSSRSTRGGT